MTTSPTKAGATPGPWTAVEHSWSRTGIYAGDIGIAALDIESDATEETQYELEAVMRANANLIAAAPLMLEALKTLHDKTAELIAHLQSTDRLRPCFNLPAIETARSAIAAATGAQGGTR